MANGEDNAALPAELVKNSQPYDIQSLLSSSGRDFLVRNNGDQVNFSVSFYLILLDFLICHLSEIYGDVCYSIVLVELVFELVS